MANALGKGGLIAGAERNLCRWNDASGGAVDEIDSEGFDLPSESDGILDGPATLGPIRGGDAQPEGKTLGPGEANGCDDLAQEAGAVLKAAAVVVGAGVDQRREELVNEIAVGGVNFNELEASLEGAAGGHGVGEGDACDGLDSERFGLNGFRGEGFGGGGIDGTPAAFGDGDGVAVIAPGNIGGGFESGVGELGSGNGSMLADEVDSSGEVLDVLVFPDSEVAGTDAAFGENGSGFGENRACTADGT